MYEKKKRYTKSEALNFRNLILKEAVHTAEQLIS